MDIMSMLIYHSCARSQGHGSGSEMGISQVVRWLVSLRLVEGIAYLLSGHRAYI